MIVLLLRLFLGPGEANHEYAHRLCEWGVYLAVAPQVQDDSPTPLGELVATALCRHEPAEANPWEPRLH